MEEKNKISLSPIRMYIHNGADIPSNREDICSSWDINEL